jgi:hypothetical protein
MVATMSHRAGKPVSSLALGVRGALTLGCGLAEAEDSTAVTAPRCAPARRKNLKEGTHD